MPKIYPWDAIADDYECALILGNGASQAFNAAFSYASLKDTAEDLGLIDENVARIFDHLETTDFEFVLRMLWHTHSINAALGINEPKTDEAYQGLKTALIEAVRHVHVSYDDVSAQLENAANFMKRFGTVASLNYDLLVYWAMLVGNTNAPNRFKDCFLSGEFQQDWRRFYAPYGKARAATLVFYPHGNLALSADLLSVETKTQTVESATLLETIIAQWEAGHAVPVFVSEGTSAQKVNSIRRSPYLSTVYDEVLPELGETIVIYGWSMSDTDDHLLDAICQKRPASFAVSVRPNSPQLAEFCTRTSAKLEARVGRKRLELLFFDATSAGCWIS